MTNVLKLTKKIFTVGVVASTMVWAVGVAALVPGVANASVCPTLAAGDMVKVTGKPAIYVVDNNLKTMYFPSGDVFKSWRPTYGGYITISMDCLDSLGIPSVAPYGVNFRAGSYVVKRPSSDQLYVVEPNNTLAKVTPEVATALYGTGYKVMTVDDQFWPNYVNRGTDVTEAKAHVGMLVSNGGKNWYVDAGNVLREVAETGMTANGFQTRFVRPVADAVVAGYTTGTAITAEVAALSDKTQSGGVTTTPTPVTGSVSVSLAADTPVGKTVPDDAEGLKVLSVNLTAGSSEVKVTGLDVSRSGGSTYAAITSIYAVADGRRLGSVKSLGSTDVVSLTFSTGANVVTIPAGQTKKFDVYVNMTDGSGQSNFVMNVTKVTTESGATVTGLPVAGNVFSIANIPSPDLAVAYESVNSSPKVGDENVEVFRVKLTNEESNEDAVVTELTIKNDSSTGTRVSSDEIAGFELYVDGESTPRATGVYDSLRNVRFVLSEPLTIAKGGSEFKRLIVKADIVGGASHYYNFELDQATDLVGYGTTDRFPLDITTSGSTTDAQVQGGDLTVAADTTNNPEARTVRKDTNGVVLLRAKMSATQQPLRVTAFGLYFEGTDIDAGDYENLKVWVGSQLVIDEATPFSSASNLTTTTVSTSDEFEVSGIQDVRVQIDSTSNTDTSDALKVTLRATDITAQRVSDDVGITESGNAAGRLVTFSSATLAATVAATPASATFALGSVNVPFVGFNLTAGTASDMKIKSVKFQFGGSGGTVDYNDVTNIRLMESNGTTVYATGKNMDSSEQVEFTGLQDLPYSLIGDGLTKKIVVVGDISSSLNDSAVTSVYFEMIDLKGIDEAGNEVEGTYSSSDITATNEVNDDGATAVVSVVSNGYLVVKQDSNTARTAQLVASTSNNSLASFRFTAEREAITVKKIVVTASTGSAADDEYTNLSLWNGSTKLMDGGQPSSGVVTFTLPTDKYVRVNPGSSNYITLTLKGDLETSNNDVLDSGANHSWAINSFATDIEADGANGDVYAELDGTTAASGRTLTAAATTSLSAAITSASATTLTVGSVTNITAGKLIKVDSEYMLVTDVSGTTLTVRRGVAGTTAATHSISVDVTPYVQKLAGNTMYCYANKIQVNLDSTPAGGAGKLRSTTGMPVLRFRVTKDASGTEPATLSAVTTTMYAVGASSTTWYVTNAYLYNIDTGSQIGSTYTTNLDDTGDSAVFTGLTDEIDADGTVFEVRVDITAASVGDNDSMSFAIPGFGSSSSAGNVIWTDSNSTITWVDTTLTTLEGNAFQN